MKNLFASLPLIFVVIFLALSFMVDRTLFGDYEKGDIKVQPDSGLLEKLPWLQEVKFPPLNKEINPDLARLKLGEGAARMVWGVTVLAQTLAFLGCLGYFFFVQYLCLKKIDPRWTNLLLMASFIISISTGTILALIGLLAKSDDKIHEYSAYISSGFLAKAVDTAKINWIGKYIDVSNGLMAAMSLAGIFAVCMTIYLATPTPRVATTQDRDLITSGIASLRGLLNASSLALIVGVIQVDFEYRWAGTLLIEEGSKKIWEPGGAAAASITLATGGFLTLMLAAAFVPAGIILYWRAIAYNAANSGAAWTKSDPDIPMDWKSLIADTFKIVGPALAAGPLAALIGK